LIRLKTKKEIEKMKKAGLITRDLLLYITEKIAPGVKTKKLDEFTEEWLKRKNAVPAFKGYRGYPASLCVSINDEVVHGIPGERVIEEGDIVSIDIGVYYDGFYGDGARTIPVGKVSETAEKLIRVAEAAFWNSLKVIKDGARIGDLSAEIQEFVEKNGFSVVKEFVGHGIGFELHEEPQVPNFGIRGTGIILKEGMTLAVEPMVNEKDYRVRIMEDGWTARTIDGGLSAHYENTIAITDNGVQVLTY
jgi:methionyl aminopeptidase